MDKWRPNQTQSNTTIVYFLVCFFFPASNTLSIKPSLDRKSLFTVAISSGRHENVERSIDDGSLSLFLPPPQQLPYWILPRHDITRRQIG